MLSETQKRVLYTFRRTGTSTREDMRRQTANYWPALKSLLKRGIVEEQKDGSYAITQEGGSYMPEVLEDDKFL